MPTSTEGTARSLDSQRQLTGHAANHGIYPLEVRASVGYAETGVGARVKMSEGPIGVVVQRKKLLRIASMFATVRYARALDPNARSALPGLAKVESLIVVPMLIGSEFVGVLYIESPERLAFEAEDEGSRELQARPPDHWDGALRLDKK